MGKIWAIASGSGGVGKTTLALSLAAGAAQRGHSTILVDASGSTRSCDLVLGLESVMSLDLVDVLSQQLDINAALYAVPQCAKLRIANASLYENAALAEFSGLMLALQSMCDVLVIDLKTGELPAREGLLTHEDELILVTRPDDASMRSTERLVQLTRGCEFGCSIVVNRIQRDKVRRGRQYANEAVSVTLDCPVMGSIAEDDGCVSEIVSGKAARGIANWMNSPVKGILNQLLNR